MEALRITVILLVLLLVCGLGLRLFAWRQIYRPSSHVLARPDLAGLEYEEILFVAEDAAALHGWWIPADGEALGTVLVCHGNAGNIGGRIELAAELHTLGVHVFLFDYRGYGESKGWPSERGLFRDARAAYEVVRARYGNREAIPLVVLGRSLGGAVAVRLASEKPVKGLVVESSFTSIRDMGRLYYPGLPVNWMVGDTFNSERIIRTLAVPKIIAHGRDDAVAPYAFGRRLFESAAPPKEFIELNGGHNDLALISTPAYRRRLEAFLREVLGP